MAGTTQHRKTNVLIQRSVLAAHKAGGAHRKNAAAHLAYVDEVMSIAAEEEYPEALRLHTEFVASTGMGAFLLAEMLDTVGLTEESIDTLAEVADVGKLGTMPAGTLAKWIAAAAQSSRETPFRPQRAAIDAIADLAHSLARGDDQRSIDHLDAVLDYAHDCQLTEPVWCPDGIRSYVPARWMAQIAQRAGRKILFLGRDRAAIENLLRSVGVALPGDRGMPVKEIEALRTALETGDIEAAIQSLERVTAACRRHDQMLPTEEFRVWKSGHIQCADSATRAMMHALHTWPDQDQIALVYECLLRRIADCLPPLQAAAVHSAAAMAVDTPAAIYRSARALIRAGRPRMARDQLLTITNAMSWGGAAQQLLTTLDPKRAPRSAEIRRLA